MSAIKFVQIEEVGGEARVFEADIPGFEALTDEHKMLLLSIIEATQVGKESATGVHPLGLSGDYGEKGEIGRSVDGGLFLMGYWGDRPKIGFLTYREDGDVAAMISHAENALAVGTLSDEELGTEEA